jgi:hypothetical protein
MDDAGMEDIAGSLIRDYNPGKPEDLIAYLNGTTLDTSMAPIDLNTISITTLDRWRIEHPLGHKLIQEKIAFPSQIRDGMGEVNRAIFYLYRRGDLSGRKVIIFMPGMGVSDLAFYPLGRYFDEIDIIRNNFLVSWSEMAFAMLNPKVV